MKRSVAKGLNIYFILLYFVLLILLATTVMFFASGNTSEGIVSACFVVVTAIATFYVIMVLRTTVSERILWNAVQIGTIHEQYMNQWDYPYAILTLDQTVLWYNQEFKKLFSDIDDLEEKSIEELLGGIKLQKGDSELEEKEIAYNGRYYFLRLNRVQIEDDEQAEEKDGLDERVKQFYTISLIDITREVELEQENLDRQTVVSLIYIDNYDLVFSSMEEGRRPLLEAMIYRRLNDMAAELGGILTRLEKDRFFLIFPHKALLKIEEGKFKILEEVRKLNIGNKLPVTLSIGVGIDEKLEQSQEYARAAVDLALGRGGDQAVIKNEERYIFYGGRTSGVEKNTRVRARLIAYALKELIVESDRVFIMGHKNPDLDCFGSALGIYRGVTALNKPAHIIMGGPHPAVMDLYRRVVEERDYADIIIDEEQALDYADENTLLILVDVNRPSICESSRLVEIIKNVAVIDHHRTSVENVGKAVVSYVEPYASSASEMVTEVLQYLTERIKLKPVEADGLFAGIALDTKNFTIKTGVRTFEAAAFLRRNGADSIRVRKMFKNDMEEYKAKAQIVASAKIVYDTMAIAEWASGMDNANAVAAQAADELLDIAGIRASFVLTKTPDQVNISARSLGDINVQLIMEKLSGGGHLTVAGAQLKGASLEEATAKLREAIEEFTRASDNE